MFKFLISPWLLLLFIGAPTFAQAPKAKEKEALDQFVQIYRTHKTWGDLIAALASGLPKETVTYLKVRAGEKPIPLPPLRRIGDLKISLQLDSTILPLEIVSGATGEFKVNQKTVHWDPSDSPEKLGQKIEKCLPKRQAGLIHWILPEAAASGAIAFGYAATFGTDAFVAGVSWMGSLLDRTVRCTTLSELIQQCDHQLRVIGFEAKKSDPPGLRTGKETEDMEKAKKLIQDSVTAAKDIGHLCLETKMVLETCMVRFRQAAKEVYGLEEPHLPSKSAPTSR